MTIDDETSKRITALRFVLIALIVYAHNNETTRELVNIGGNANFSIFSLTFLFKAIPAYISIICVGMAVQIFFMISSYLQYKKDDPYPVLLKKRVKSLLMPLISWPLLIIGLKILWKIFLNKFFPNLVSDPSYIPFINDGWTFWDWFQAIFGYYNDPENIIAGGYLQPLWFIRDLFILVLISPVLKKCVDKLPLITFVLPFFCCFYNIRPLIVAPHALFYYLVGFYWAKYDVELFKIADKVEYKFLLPMSFLLLIFSLFVPVPVSTLIKIISFFLLFKISKNIISKEKLFRVFKYLSAYSFFLYAIHAPFLKGIISKIWFRLFPRNIVCDFFEFFIVGTAIIVVGTGLGILLEKICPILFALLNGGRIKQKKIKKELKYGNETN